MAKALHIVKKLTATGCELCKSSGGELLWHDDCCRVVMVNEENYPGLCRVILQDHVREMTDLEPLRRARLMQAVFATERALRTTMEPAKVNLASLGNMTPHLHWHVIPRFADDAHFPDAIWSTPRRPGTVRSAPAPARLAGLIAELMDGMDGSMTRVRSA